MRRASAAVADPIAPITARFLPPPDLTVSAWADAERVLPETSAEPGRWKTSRVPYMRAVMDAVTDPAVETIVVKASAQVAKSETLLNVLGFHIAHDPCPMLLVQPTIDMAEAFSKDRLAKTIAATPALARLVQEGRGPGAESTLRNKQFPGGFLALAGANSAASLAQRAVRLLMCDDLDRFPIELEDEGDPVELAIKRTTTFWNRKILLVSTPTIRGGRIDGWYERSDQRRFVVPCPRCGRRDYLTFSDAMHVRIVFDAVGDPIARAATARLECPAPDHGGCGGRIEDHERPAMVACGEWRPTATAKEPGLVGFHVWEAYSPWGSLAGIVSRFLAALGKGQEALRVVVNTVLGEAYAGEALQVEPQGLLARREDYGIDVEIPDWVSCLTAGVDTQDDRFEVLVLGWGPGEEKAVIDWRPVPGDPAHAETRAALLEQLARRYRHAAGITLPIHAACIDRGGHRTDEVDKFVLAHQHRRIYAVRGQAGLSGNPIVGTPTRKRFGADNSPRPVPLYPVNVDDAKTRLMSDLALEPGPARRGSGLWHFPLGVDTVNEAFFAQLTAEQLVPRRSKSTGVVERVWQQIRDANHALDCAVYALAALRLLNPNLVDMLGRVRLAGQTQEPPASARAMLAAAPPPVPPRLAERGFGRSEYLCR